MIKPLQINFRPYAMTDDLSQGRLKKVSHLPDDFRSEFQHDRDRIIHSKSFRRLESKTQVVVSNESDHNRKRLTHSIEVMQISDSIAYALGVNIFLTQAIALGHDLGHAPFGHGGEEALHRILKNHNLPGFKHNYQSLLVVNKLESRYMDEGGLNLMYETRDGILKHTKITDDIPLSYYDEDMDQTRINPITIEGQIVRLVDEIAQRTHDTDDGLRTDRIDINDLLEEPIMEKILHIGNLNRADISQNFKKHRGRTISKIVISMIKYYVNDVVKETCNNLSKFSVNKYDDVKSKDQAIVSFSKEVESLDRGFQKKFLKPHFYRSYDIKQMDSRGAYFINQLFKAYKRSPRQMPERAFKEFKRHVDLYSDGYDCSDSGCAYKASEPYINIEEDNICPLQIKELPACDGVRVIVNYLAGMTDRHANREYAKLYLPPEV